MNICIGSDHAGFWLKKQLVEWFDKNATQIFDVGCFSEESTDYPDFAHKVGKNINENNYTFGIVICGSGNGVNMVANKYPKVRSALCWNTEIAELARKHNDANVLALPARYITFESAVAIVKIFLQTEFEGGRHLKRVEKINSVL